MLTDTSYLNTATISSYDHDPYSSTGIFTINNNNTVYNSLDTPVYSEKDIEKQCNSLCPYPKDSEQAKFWKLGFHEACNMIIDKWNIYSRCSNEIQKQNDETESENESESGIDIETEEEENSNGNSETVGR